MREFLKAIREEWPVIRQAPWTILFTVLLLSSIVGGFEYWLFHENLSRKNDLIQTLRGQVEMLKTRAAKSEESLKQPPPPSTGPATAKGIGGIANTGSGNTFNTSQTPVPPKGQK